MRYQRKPFSVDAALYQPGLEDCWLVLDSGCVRQHIARTRAEAEGWLERHGHMAERIVPGLTQGGAEPVRIKDGDYIVSPDNGPTFVMHGPTFRALYELGSAWQPMETAPRDRAILVCVDMGDTTKKEIRVTTAEFEDWGTEEDPSGRWVLSVPSEYPGDNTVRPLGWMDAPKPMEV